MKKKLQRFKVHWIQFTRTRASLWVGAVLLSGLLAIYWDTTKPTPPAHTHELESVESAATHIPAGFVLVPIEVSNYESLDSILGKYGVVDLYSPSTDPRVRPVKVAERVKILRAPLNPSHFAVLAPEDMSSNLVAHGGPFMVVVQNPAQAGTRFVNPVHRDIGKNSPTESRKASGSGAKRSRIYVEVFSDN